MWLVLLAAAGAIGTLIGLTGVGGVLMGPTLVSIGGLPPHAAAATSSWSFLFTGAVGTLVYTRLGLIPWRMLGVVTVGVLPGAFLGARLAGLLPPGLIVIAMAVLATVIGLRQLAARDSKEPRDADLSWRSLIIVGGLVGAGSALTGTGGPILLVPVLLACGVAPVQAVGLGQAVQLPVVVSATAGFLDAGTIDFRTGTALGCCAAVGTLAGAALMTRVDARGLGRIVGLACVVAGLVLVIGLVA